MNEPLKKKNSYIKYIIAVVIILFLTSFALLYVALAQKPKPDPASEYYIRKSAKDWLNNKTLLNKEPNDLDDTDFAKITNFSIGGYAWDIRLLEKFTNLWELELRNIRYPNEAIPKWQKFLAKHSNYNPEEKFTLDLRPIENLHNLEIFVLTGSSCKDIRPVSNLVNLRYLSLSDTGITNLKPIKSLTSLHTLNIINTKVSNLEPLMELKNLQRLYIEKCDNITDKQIEDLQKALPNLMIIRNYERNQRQRN